MACLNLYKVLENKDIQICPDVIETYSAKIANPTEEIAHQFGYWPLEETERPEEKEDYKIFDDKYSYVDVADGKKVVHIWRQIPIVDEPPELPEGYAFAEDHWEDQGDKYVHVYNVLEKVDNPPSLEEGQQIVEDHWEIQTFEIPDEMPEFTPELMFDDDGYPVMDEETGEQKMTQPPEQTYTTVEKYVHVYTVRFIVDNPPVLEENEFIYEEHWDDDGVIRTHVYDVWTIVEENPEEIEGYRLCDLGIIDDPETKTRTHLWKNKKIVDEKPEDDPEGNFWYVNDYEEETDDEIIIVYRQEFRQWRIFSKLKLEYVAFRMGLLSNLDEFLDAEKLTNDQGEQVALKRFYDQANELGEKHGLFKPYYHKALQVLGLTEEQGEEILKQIVAEPTLTSAE